jgi:hypothetical protein
LTRNYEDGSLYATVSLGLHAWWGWPEELGTFYVPEGSDLAKRSFATTVTKLMFLVPVDGLPMPPSGPQNDAGEVARRALAVLVPVVDEVVAPIIRQVESR